MRIYNNGIHSSFYDVLANAWKSAKVVENIVARALEGFGIRERHLEVEVDTITVTHDKQHSCFRASSDSKDLTLPVIYCIYKNRDQNAGDGPMVPWAWFFDILEAVKYIDNLQGVQGRRENWARNPGDYYIDILPVFLSAASADQCNEAADSDARAYQHWSDAHRVYEERATFLKKHGHDIADLRAPVIEDYTHENKHREFADPFHRFNLRRPNYSNGDVR